MFKNILKVIPCPYHFFCYVITTFVEKHVHEKQMKTHLKIYFSFKTPITKYLNDNILDTIL